MWLTHKIAKSSSTCSELWSICWSNLIMNSKKSSLFGLCECILQKCAHGWSFWSTIEFCHRQVLFQKKMLIRPIFTRQQSYLWKKKSDWSKLLKRLRWLRILPYWYRGNSLQCLVWFFRMEVYRIYRICGRLFLAIFIFKVTKISIL